MVNYLAQTWGSSAVKPYDEVVCCANLLYTDTRIISSKYTRRGMGVGLVLLITISTMDHVLNASLV